MGTRGHFFGDCGWPNWEDHRKVSVTNFFKNHILSKTIHFNTIFKNYLVFWIQFFKLWLIIIIVIKCDYVAGIVLIKKLFFLMRTQAWRSYIIYQSYIVNGRASIQNQSPDPLFLQWSLANNVFVLKIQFFLLNLNVWI